ncbi:SCO4225 family membrane protein [Streptomyces cucumeris]|uniref:SCO4225 family membrane protein n=1 Tax=Streptomyces cucumeris TaxID=2962890 RepID=UPI003D74DEC9
MQRVGSLRGLILGNSPSRFSLGVVAVAVVFWLAASGVHDQPDVSFASVYPLVVTSPVAIGLLGALEPTWGAEGAPGWLAPAFEAAAMAAGAVVNAFLIGRVARWVGRPRGQ